MFSGCEDPFLFDVVNQINRNNDFVTKISAIGNDAFAQLEGDVELIQERQLHREETVRDAFTETHAVTLDDEILSKFNECKSYFLRTVDRVFIVPKSSRRLDSYFQILLSNFLGYFEKNSKIECVFFDASPHFPWDIVLFFVARYKDIETRILRRTLIGNRVILDQDFRNVDEDFIRFPDDVAFIDHNLQNVEQESFWIKQSKNVNKKLSESVFSLKSLAFITSFPWMLQFIAANYNNYKNSYMRLEGYEYFLHMLKQKIQILRLKEWLNKNCISPDLSIPYVYFAMHFQPERTTDPEAGVFSNQFLAIKLLADNLPDGWKIYVKEHPRQVNSHPDVKYRHYRTLDDYQMIQALDNVHIIHPASDSKRLIESCRITASCTGSTVWEGILQGKPGVNFGRVWHKSCRSSLLINSVDDARRAFQLLSEKSKDEVLMDVEQFISEFRSAMIVSVNYEGAAKASDISRNILVSNLSEAIIRSISCH